MRWVSRVDGKQNRVYLPSPVTANVNLFELDTSSKHRKHDENASGSRARVIRRGTASRSISVYSISSVDLQSQPGKQ
jgi:hypothetical protein